MGSSHFQKKLSLAIVLPALNEEVCLPLLFDSLRKQNQISCNAEIIVVDNGSTDKTVQISKDFGCTVLYCKKKGVGCARQKGVNYVLKRYKRKLDETIIFQLDADEQLVNRNCLASIYEEFSKNSSVMVSVGPTYYEIERSRRRKRIIRTGKNFRKVFGTKSLEEIFSDYNKDINDYLIPSRSHKLFVGGNTCYRASVFTLPNVRFPKMNVWETVVISIRIQQQIKPFQIKFIKEQIVLTSPRSYINSRGLLSEKNLNKIRKLGYISPFKANGTLSPSETAKLVIDQMDKEKHALRNRRLKGFEES